MAGSLDIMYNLVSRKIYNLCFKEGLSKREISERLHGKWLPNAVLPKIKRLQKAGYLKFVEEGKNYQRKRGKYFATVLPILEFMKTLTEPMIEEINFLESDSLKREFLRINKDLLLEDDWLRPLRTFLEDILLFRMVNVTQIDKGFFTKFEEVYKQIANDPLQKGTKDYNSLQNGTIVLESLQYDRIIQKSIEIFGEQYEIPKNITRSKDTLTNINEHQNILRNVKKPQETSNAITSYLKTDYLCLSLLMPEKLCSRIKFSSPRGEIFSILEGMMIRVSLARM